MKMWSMPICLKSTTAYESSRYRQHARFATGDEPAVCHSGYSTPHGQGLGGYVPVGYGGRERADRVIRDVQVPAPAGTPEPAYQLLRRMGGDIHPKDRRLRAGRNGDSKAQRAFPYIHQSTGTGNVPA